MTSTYRANLINAVAQRLTASHPDGFAKVVLASAERFHKITDKTDDPRDCITLLMMRLE